MDFESAMLCRRPHAVYEKAMANPSRVPLFPCSSAALALQAVELTCHVLSCRHRHQRSRLPDCKPHITIRVGSTTKVLAKCMLGCRNSYATCKGTAGVHGKELIIRKQAAARPGLAMGDKSCYQVNAPESFQVIPMHPTSSMHTRKHQQPTPCSRQLHAAVPPCIIGR